MRHLICFDIESTGTDPARDRLVSLALCSLNGEVTGNWLVNPGIAIPETATEVHGITNEEVESLPGFGYHAADIHAILKDADLLGFNLTNFDIPILWEEFHRVGIEWDLSNTNVIDAGTLFKKREERTLAAAVKFYTGQDHTNSHDAMSDVMATINVFSSQLGRYGLLGVSNEKLMAESSYDEKRVDLAGKIVIGKDGRPAYNIGKAKGVAVVDDPGFGNWMLDRDFTANTKMHLNRILYGDVRPVSHDASSHMGYL
jgi:DNA polymerase-3 subunit epsilon